MESIKVTTHVGDDGLLKIQLPNQMANQDMEVVVIYQPVNKSSKDDLGRD